MEGISSEFRIYLVFERHYRCFLEVFARTNRTGRIEILYSNTSLSHHCLSGTNFWREVRGELTGTLVTVVRKFVQILAGRESQHHGGRERVNEYYCNPL